ncbi:MAG TPA: hypothetical protein VMI73_16705 [Trebonia sp.]|nr:hypothetical protein [Trebonia sp.]
MTTTRNWPSGQNQVAPSDSEHADGQSLPLDDPPCQEHVHAVMGEMADLLRDVRGSLMADGCILGGVTIGLALQTGDAAGVLRMSLSGFVNLALLGGMLACWLAAVFSLARSARPVLNKLSELRWVTGAPVDPRAGWLTMPPAGADPTEWTWHRALLLVGAARLARHRMLFADTWTYLAGGYFLAWSVVIMLGR